MRRAILMSIILLAGTASADTGDAPPPTNTPTTDFSGSQQPMDAAALTSLKQQLQGEYNIMMTPVDGETSDQAALRQQGAAALLKRINRISSLLLTLQ